MKNSNARNVLINATSGMINDNAFPMGMPLTAKGGQEIARLKQDRMAGMQPRQRSIINSKPAL